MTIGIAESTMPLTKMHSHAPGLENDKAGNDLTVLINTGNGDDIVQIAGNNYGLQGGNSQGNGDGAANDNQSNDYSDLFSQTSNSDVKIDGGSGDDTIIINGPVNGPIDVDGGSGDDTIIINGNNQPSSPEPEEPVAANESGYIHGDPHFKGGDGGTYDVQGEAGKTYSLLTDSGLDLRGEFEAWGSGGATVVGQTGMTLSGEGGSDYIEFNKDGSASINSQEMEEGETYDLADGGTATLDNGKLSVTTAEGYTIDQTAKGSGDSAYINIDVSTGENGVGNGQLPGGLLGQTFDADDVARNGAKGANAQGEGAIDGVVTDYECDTLSPLFEMNETDKSSPVVSGSLNVDGGSGDDTITINGPVNGAIDIDGGSGDDTIIINGGKQPEPPESEDPVAANEEGRIWGDPHFVGGDGGTYDVMGEDGKIYDLLSDSGLELRGQFEEVSDGVTYVGETGLTVGEGMNSDHINFRKDGSASINGQSMEEGQTYDLIDGGTATLEDGKLTTTTAEGYTIVQQAYGDHINIDVSTGENGVDNGQMPGGLLGQTFDADDVARNGAKGAGAQGEGAIDGDVSDYEVNALDPINDNRGETDETDTENTFESLIEQLQTLMEELLGLLNQFKTVDDTIQHHVDAGSGDDTVEINADGNYDIELGSGDDEVFVNFDEGEATIQGGSGDDTVTLSGSESDYTVTQEGEYTVYTYSDGQSVRVASDVETVNFASEEA